MLWRRPPHIVAAGAQVAVTNAGSTNVAIPNRADGNRARWVIISLDTNDLCYLQPGLSGGSASTTTSPVFSMAGGPIILDVTGHTHIHGRLLVAGPANLKVTPLENQ